MSSLLTRGIKRANRLSVGQVLGTQITPLKGFKKESHTDRLGSTGMSGQTGNVSAQRYIWFIDGFPMTVSGKLHKYHTCQLAQEKMAAGVCV